MKNILLCTFLCLLCLPVTLCDFTPAATATEDVSPQTALTYDKSTFWGGFKISVSEKILVAKSPSVLCASCCDEIIKIPVQIENMTDRDNLPSLLLCRATAPNGYALENVCQFFKDSISTYTPLPAHSCHDAFFYMPFHGEGIYSVYLSDFIDSVTFDVYVSR